MSSKKSKKLLFLEKVLRRMAILVINKYSPRIIGITGSVGKTSAKEAIFSVLSGHFRVRKSEKNYNNEIGLPLTVIGAETGKKSVLRWLGVFFKWLAVFIFPIEYPEVLILEMGADRPGDIKYLAGFIKCEIAVVTDISGSHLEYFDTLDKVSEEKWNLVENLKAGGLALVNIDNFQIAKLKEISKKEVKFLTFGFSESAEIRAAEVFYNYSTRELKEKIKGLSFKLNYKGTAIPVRLNNILAQHSIYAALAGISAGIAFKLNLVEIAAALENFSMPCGRMNLIAGIKNTLIIDDGYNASPVSTQAALEVMKNIEAPRKIAVLGDMLELGNKTEVGHREAAKKFMEIKGDIFMAVGKRMKFAVEELKKHNLSDERLFWFESPMKAGKKLENLIREGDLILIKGSQGMRMEKIVEEIMDEPNKASACLCRQNKEWKDKPWKEV